MAAVHVLPPEVVVGQELHSGILTPPAIEKERVVKVCALIEREGEHGGRRRIGGEGEVHDTDAMDPFERGWTGRVDARPGVEALYEVLLEISEAALHDGLDVILVSETDAGRDSVEGRFVGRRTEGSV